MWKRSTCFSASLPKDTRASAAKKGSQSYASSRSPIALLKRMPPFPSLLPLLVLASIAAAFFLSPLVIHLARGAKAVDKPSGGRKIHHLPTALWGGLVTGSVIIVGLFLVLPFLDGKDLQPLQVTGFAIAILVLLIGGMIDDRFDLSPGVQFLFPLVASLVILVTGSSIVQVTNPMGMGAFSMVWFTQTFGPLTIALPADILTMIWLLTVTYAMKLLDGLDGLVAGMTVIGGGLIAALASSDAYFQPLVALLALVVAGAYLGILPRNREGSLFLGEAGSTIAGFSLGVLAIISGTKVATAATALAIPLVDIAFVLLGRVAAGQSPFQGDTRHLHFRLLHAGLSPRTAVRLIWGIALVFGLLALTMQTRGRLFLFAGLIVLTGVISVMAWSRSKK